MKRKLLLGLIVAAGLTSCEVEEVEPTIDGKWIIESATMLGMNIPGDGSYLELDDCGGAECTGTDYDASDPSAGTITYSLSADETKLTITDDENEGGSWGGTWQIVKFTDSELDIKINTLFGEVKYEMTK